MAALLVLLSLALLGLAFHFQFSGTLRTAALILLAIVAIGLAILWYREANAAFWLGTAAVMLGATLWWSTIRPSNDRDWTPDVAHGVTADIGPDSVTLHNVRNFDWQTVDAATERWETRSYELSDLTSVDVFSSVWGNPAIAHTLVSFGFTDGQHVVFSAEIRKQKGEAYSSLAGFFRRYELVLIAADERDIIRLRTDVRGETVSLYPLDVTQPHIRQMFLDLLALGNDLAVQPRFYNTATTNCTTVQWRLARNISPTLPFNWRVLLSGYLPAYLQSLGVVRTDLPLDQLMAQARLHPTGPANADGAEYSRRLRSGTAP